MGLRDEDGGRGLAIEAPERGFAPHPAGRLPYHGIGRRAREVGGGAAAFRARARSDGACGFDVGGETGHDGVRPKTARARAIDEDDR
jgi:hypothetical protein